MPSNAGLFRAYALPVVWMFALPGFALWFSGHASERYDRGFYEALEPEIRADARLTTEQREDTIRYYRERPPSRVCTSASPELAQVRASLGEACSDVQQFHWLRQLALASMALGAASLLFALACALTSFVSRPMQYLSFYVGWNVLKLVGAVQAVLQGASLVFLSYWMTALWLERYSVKLILCVAAVVAFAVWKVLVAIFRKPPLGIDIEGELVEEVQAPELWQRIRTLCQQIDTAPPQHLVAGVDANFFVTEGEVRVGDKRLQGRTLYVSLSLLRMLKRSEAEAVLAHEMAHFGGGDTAHSNRLAPMMARFTQYLQALHEGVVTRPIFHFMFGYYSLLAFSLSRSSRAREFAADALAARLTSPADIAHSLIKIGAYASYRGRVEEALFENEQRNTELSIAQRVAEGFSGYATTEAVHFDLHDAVTPHPFDSHPRLSERIKNVDAHVERAQYGDVLLAPATHSWIEAVAPAQEIEQRLWAAYEARFSAAHELSLAYRYEPANDEERAHVERFFPAVTFEGKQGKPGVSLSYAQIEHAEWDAPLAFSEVASLALNKRMFKSYLDIKLANAGLFGGKRSICLDQVENADALVDTLGRYYGRHQHMKAQQADKASKAA
jgi:Zn-dependent protease with chaperone function